MVGTCLRGRLLRLANKKFCDSPDVCNETFLFRNLIVVIEKVVTLLEQLSLEFSGE